MSDPDASKNRQARWLGRLVLESLEPPHLPPVKIVELELSRETFNEVRIRHLYDEPHVEEGSVNVLHPVPVRATDGETSDVLVFEGASEDLA